MSATKNWAMEVEEVFWTTVSHIVKTSAFCFKSEW